MSGRGAWWDRAWRAFGSRPRVGGVTTTGPKPWVRATESAAACPVPDAERTWIERRMRWCAAEFGPQTVHRQVALPVADFFPAGFTGSSARTAELVGRVCAVMAVAEPGAVSVHLYDGAAQEAGTRHTVGRYRKVLGRALIELDRGQAANPAVFAALIAHELAHVRLLGERRRQYAEDEEKLTDLLTVYLGMGVFTANAAHWFTRSVEGYSVLPLGDLTEQMLTGSGLDPTIHRLGYLSDREFGYALACYCRLREEADPPWARHVNSGARAALRQGLRYLAG